MAILNYDKCVLLLPMNGLDNGVLFNDYSSARTKVIVVGNTKTVTSQSKFYGSSAYFDGSGDALSIPFSATFDPKNLNFGISLWLKTQTTQVYTGLFGRDTGAFLAGSFALLLNSGSANGRLQLWNASYNAGAPHLSMTSGTVADNVWHHIELDRYGSVFTLYVDGIAVATSTWSGTIATINAEFAIGGDPGYTSRYLAGWIQDFAFCIGAPLHYSEFTPPGKHCGTISNAAVDCIRDTRGEPVVRAVQAVSRLGGATTVGQSDASGRYSLFVPAIEHNVLLLDSEDKYYDLLIGNRVMPE